MFEKTKKKLIHFNTSGSIAEDFLASKRKKCARLRLLIRCCFIFHLVAAIACAGLDYFFGADYFIAIAVCAGIDVVMAFFAAGGETSVKAALVGLDAGLAAAGIITGILNGNGKGFVYFLFSGIMAVAALWAVAEMIAAYLRNYLQKFPVKNLRKEDYTLTGKPSGSPFELELPRINGLDADDKKMPLSLPPLTSEMRELANKLSDILNNAPADDELGLDAAVEIEVEGSESGEPTKQVNRIS